MMQPASSNNRLTAALPFLIAVLLFGFSVTSCDRGIMAGPLPRATKGAIDASAIDLAGGDTVHLTGDWKFIWLQDNPAFADPRFDDTAWKSIAVPGYWNKLTGSGRGYGWYRIRVRIDGDRLRASKISLALSIRLIQSAYEVYVNGTRITGCGTVGTDQASSVPQLLPRLESFTPPAQGDEIVIAIRNSNFSHRSGGPYTIPELGLHAVLVQQRWHADVIHLVALGILIMMCLYHAMLWLGRREDRASLYFFLGCLVILLRLIATSGYLERLFPNAHLYELHFKIVYASIPLGWMTFALFFRELFGDEFSGRILAASTALAIIFVLSILVLPCRIYSLYSTVYEGSLLVFGTWFLVGIIIAAWRKRLGAIFMLPGFIAFFITGVHDILAVRLIVTTPELAPVGLVFMAFSQSAVLSSRFSRAFRTAEHLSRNLALEVAGKTEQLREQIDAAVEAKGEVEASRAELRDAYERLNALYTIIKNDLGVAKTIQDTLFPTNAGSILGLRYHAQYIPLIEVGGDVYDISVINESTIRFFIADATGHGVHASLITMLIKGEYDMLKYGKRTPVDIITELNDKFYHEYRTIARFFTAFLVDIDIARKKITYVSSGHPAQYLIRDGSVIELETTGRAIGFTEQTNCTQREVDFLHGDRILCFTDGLYEQFDGDRTLFGEERIKRIIENHADCSILEIMQDIIAAIDHHTDKDLNDDIIIIGIE